MKPRPVWLPGVDEQSCVQICRSRLNLTDRATNPSNRQEDWEYIMGFCDQVNKELEGYGHIVSIHAFLLKFDS